MSTVKAFLIQYEKQVLLISGTLILTSFFIYSYYTKKQAYADTSNGNRVTLTGTITGIYQTRGVISVEVKYFYKDKLLNSEYTTNSYDSINVGTRVRLIVSKLHPTKDIGYVGVVH